MEYAQLHTEILADPKLMRAARKGLKGLELAPWFFAFAKKAQDDGRLTVNGEAVEPADLVPLIPGQTVRTILTSLKSLESIGVLARDEGGILYFVAWEVRQAAPSSSNEAVAARVRKHRERKRNAAGNEGGVTGGNVTDVTSGNGATETESNRTEPNGTQPSSTAGDRREEPRVGAPHAAMDRLRVGIPAEYHPDLDALLTKVRDPKAWAGELTMAVEGGTAGTAVTYADLGQALHDFRLNGKAEEPSAMLLRAYIKRASGDRRRPTRDAPAGTPGRTVSRVTPLRKLV